MNADDDHRCRRCGRRLMGEAVEAPPEHARRALQAVGANALAAATAEMERPVFSTDPTPERKSSQSSLFLDEPALKVVPKRQELPETAELPPVKPKKAKKMPDLAGQGTQAELDFLPPVSHAARMLKTTVEATIYCDFKVAGPVHRATAAALDALVIAGSMAVFAGIFAVFGGPMELNKQTIPILAGAIALIALFYGFIWMLADTETAGMRWTELKLVSFNGFPPDRKTRALRTLGCFLSFCSGTIGILWALVDEEGLTWHDHMSKTFPTLRDGGSLLIRQ